MIENHLKYENIEKLDNENEKLYDINIPVHHAENNEQDPNHITTPSFTWLSTKSFEPATDMDICTSLREEIMEFEKEYKDVQEIVKKDHIKKSITILLESSKSY